MFKYLHEILGLLHDFISDGRPSGHETSDGALAAEGASAAPPKTATGAPAPARQTR